MSRFFDELRSRLGIYPTNLIKNYLITYLTKNKIGNIELEAKSKLDFSLIVKMKEIISGEIGVEANEIVILNIFELE